MPAEGRPWPSDNNDGDDDCHVKMTIQGDSGGPLVACGMDGNCGTMPGQNYDLIGIEIIVINIVAIIMDAHKKEL